MRGILLFLIPAFAIASTSADAAHNPDYDIVERIINFVIFFSILYYLAAKPLKALYQSRIDSIAGRLKSTEEKLKASNSKKEEALRRLQNAKTSAAELVEMAKKETELIRDKVAKETQAEIESMQRSFDASCEFETRRMSKTVVSEVLDDVLDPKNLQIEQKELINIILKKVS
ncbi:F0F1 ATP synthase subunit B [Campylobacter sp. 19-13652]|uniref:F0F1 ATP synthase subunit B n=1 Tax=Campylobacter sp. 19-13652 TaxID=2840180 RepID=UPI001C75017B|nr:F0F1 ATP synthase subunit B [Campylobacter sp. 19-13652]BCX78943.1 ATP synthase subunit b [Campylobacter sp. 19-13652]